MLNNWVKFDWQIDKNWVKILFCAVLPGLVVSIYTHEMLWTLGSFLAACGIIPYTTSYDKRWIALFNMLVICALAYVVKYLLALNIWPLTLGFIVLLAAVAGTIDNIHPQLRSLSAWLVIGTIYGGVKLSEYPLAINQLLGIIALAFLGVLLVIALFKSEVKQIELKLVHYSHPDFMFNFKYVAPIGIAGLIWYAFKIKEPEWLLWSSLSVVNTELNLLFEKFRQRAIGVVIGVVAGLGVGLLLPHSQIVAYTCFVVIIIGLKCFKDYFTGYLVRSFFVILYAGNHSLEIALLRSSNVLIGGLIGVVATSALLYVHQYYLNSKHV